MAALEHPIGFEDSFLDAWRSKGRNSCREERATGFERCLVLFTLVGKTPCILYTIYESNKSDTVVYNDLIVVNQDLKNTHNANNNIDLKTNIYNIFNVLAHGILVPRVIIWHQFIHFHADEIKSYFYYHCWSNCINLEMFHHSFRANIFNLLLSFQTSSIVDEDI